MIAIAMAGHADGDSPRFWFDRAVSAQMDYLPAYKRIRWAMRPRWGGSHVMMYQFGLECAATERYDTWVPIELFWALHDVADDMDGDWEYILGRRNSYETMKSMLRGYAAEPRSPGSRNWAVSMQAVAAYRAGKWKHARKALDEIDCQIDQVALDNFKVEKDPIISEVYAHTGPAAEVMGRARGLYDARAFAEALPLYRKALSAMGPEDPGRPRTCLRTWQAERLAAFDQGKWVSILPAQDMLGWRHVSGTWKTDGKTYLEGTTENGRALRLICELPLSSNMELRGKLHFDKSPHKLAMFAVVMGRPNEQWWRSVMLFPESDQVLAKFESIQLSESKPIGGRKVEIGPETHFKICLSRETVTVHVNGKCAISRQPIEYWRGGDQPTVELAAYYWQNGAKVRTGDLEVRKLDPWASPGPAD